MEKTLAKHVSAGAVVFKKIAQTIQILAMYRAQSDTWHLPKGTKIDGEDVYDTAQREILEETGYQINILSFLGRLESMIERETGITIPKETIYYIAELIAERPERLPDNEHDKVEFVEINRLINLIKNKRVKGYESEHLILEKFLESSVHSNK